MDKYEYKLRLEEIKTLNKKGRFQESAQIADTIDWKKVRNTSTLGIISDVYKINRRFDDAREILLLANEKSPQNRRIVYALCDLAIKTGQVVEAVEYYKQFVQLSPNDNSKYILLYKIYEAQDISLEERIAVLKEYKKREYNEKWAYELAFLYHRVGLATECVEECDQLILWFGEGKYVLKAMELKRLYVPLSPAQQQLYDSQYGGRNAVEEEPQEAPAPEQTQAVQSAESKEKEDLDIHVKPMDMGQYNTINLQEALAASMRDVFEVDREEAKPASPEPEEEPDLTKNQQTVYAAENGNGEYQEDISRVLEESDQWDAQATGQLDTEETRLAADVVDGAESVSVQSTQSTPQVHAVVEPTLPVTSSSEACAYVTEPVNAQPEAPIFTAQPVPEQTPAATDPADAGMQEIHPAVVETPWMPMETDKTEPMQGVEIQEKAAAVPERQPERKAVVGNTKIERQTTGQMNIEEVLKEWERLKKENEEKRKQETRQWMLQQTGSLFDDFDESSRNGVLEQLQREESLPVEGEKAPANAENQEAPAGERAAVETTAAKAPLADPSRETEAEELEEIEEAPAADAAQGYAEQDAEPVQRYAKQPTPERIEAPAAEETQALRQEAPVPERAGAPAAEETKALRQEAPVPKRAGAPAAEETKAPRQEAPAPQPEISGEEKGLQERVSQQQAAERVRSMTKAERKLFAQFIPTKRAMRQLVAALDEISLSAYTGNVVITGMPGSGTLKLTKCMIREIQASDGNFSGKVAKVNAELINKKDAKALVEKVANGALVIEKAGKLSSEGCEKLADALNQDHTGIIVFALDEKRAIDRLYKKNGRLMESFTARFDIAALDSATLVKYGCQYAYTQEYSIDELGRLALHTRIEDMQTSSHAVTVGEVRDIVDEAIDHANRKTIGHFIDIVLRRRYDEDDMIILREKDFI